MKLTRFGCMLVFVLPLLSFIFVQAQTEHDKGVAAFKNKKFDEAIASLKKATQENPADATNWQYLGLSYMSKNQTSDALKAFKKAVELNPNDAADHANLAYAHLVKNHKDDAQFEAQKAVSLNSKIALAHYVLGSLDYKAEIYDGASEKAGQAIKLNPNFAAAYFLKTVSLISLFAQQNADDHRTVDSRSKLLTEAAENLEKYMSLSPNDSHTKVYQEYFESLKFFADYYNLPKGEFPRASPSVPSPGEIPLVILSKHPAEYTDRARQNQTTGIIRVLIGFAADGKTKHILVIKFLGDGLDEQAVSAAHDIKFKPAMKNGVPISVVKVFEYTFNIGL